MSTTEILRAEFSENLRFAELAIRCGWDLERARAEYAEGLAIVSLADEQSESAVDSDDNSEAELDARIEHLKAENERLQAEKQSLEFQNRYGRKPGDPTARVWSTNFP